MKKKYEKPVVHIEEFVINEIMSSCGSSSLGTPTQGDPNSCSFGNGFIQLFYAEPVCSMPVGDADGEDYCYNFPSGSENAVFGS